MDRSLASRSLSVADEAVYRAIENERHRQNAHIELIASENFVSRAVLEAQGSILTNKYAEGYPGRRYYEGCECVDEVETMAIERAKRLFGCNFANVQPHSGSQANQAVMLATLSPGDTFLGMSLSAGGHLTHGATPNQSGKWFHAVGYGVRRDDERIDYDEVRRLAQEHKPKLIIAGVSSYARVIDFEAFAKIAREVGALFLVDMAHIAGLVAAGIYPSPFPHADVVTTTTHKTLRGPRGGMILTNGEAMAKKINSAVFPGMQGGPLMHVIAGKAVAFGEALEPSFKAYGQDVIRNAQVLAETLTKAGYRIVSGGTDTHMVLVDLRSKGLKGSHAAKYLGDLRIACNKNGMPFDDEKPTVTSGIRLGSAACTTRGFGEKEFRRVGTLIAEALDALARCGEDGQISLEARDRFLVQVAELTDAFPLYPQ